MKNTTLKNTVLAGLFAALTFAATYISIPLPANGYANLGDCFVIISGIILGPFGTLAAAIGSALCDLVLGFVYYAPATFIIKGIMAGIAFLIMGKKPLKYNALKLIITVLVCELIMILGYFAFEIPLYGVGTALADIFGNSLQGLVGAVCTFTLYTVLFKTKIMQIITGDKK